MSRLVFDIGGTNTRLALSVDGALAAKVKYDTPREPAEALARIRQYLTEQGSAPEEAVGGVAGSVADGAVLIAPNLPAWNGFNLAAALTDMCGIPSVRVLNDAAVAGLAEAREGAGKDMSIVGYVGIGTGIGGVLVIDGEVAPAHEGIEPGKQIIEVAERRTLEDLASGAALEREFATARPLLDAAVREERTRALAAGLYNLARTWSPDILVLNGSLMNENDGFRLSELTNAMHALADGVYLPKLVKAEFGDDSALIGAAAYRFDAQHA